MKLLSLLLLLSFTTSIVSAQTFEKLKKKEVPEKVLANFIRLFSDAKKQDWRKSANSYEVDFEINFKSVTSVFDTSGKWILSNYKVDIKEIILGFPTVSMKHIDNTFPNCKVTNASIQLNPSGKMFIVGIDPDADKKTKEKLNLYFDERGYFLRQEPR